MNDASYRGVEVARVEEYLEKALKLTETDNDRFEYQLAVLRTVTAVKGKDWLDRAEAAYRAAQSLEKLDERRLDYYQGKEAAAYFMGLAYLEGYQFRKAEDKFRETLDSRKMGKWNEPADKAWKKTAKIVRAMGNHRWRRWPQGRGKGSGIPWRSGCPAG